MVPPPADRPAPPRPQHDPRLDGERAGSPRRRVYFDNAATSFPKPEAVSRAMTRFHTAIGASPGRGSYRETLVAADLLGECRRALARLVNAPSAEHVVFTLNTSHALNTAIKGILRPFRIGGPDRPAPVHAVITDMEHNSVLRPINALAGEFPGLVSFTRVAPDPATGLVDPERVVDAIRPETRLVATVHASNVTGTLQPVRRIGALCREHAVPFLVDAAQTVGHYPVDMERLNIDLLAFPGHKGLLGPLGTGALAMRPGIERILHTHVEGGTGSVSELDTQPDAMPDKLEPGSHNTVGIAGLLEGVRYVLDRGIDDIWEHERALIAQFIEGLHRYAGGPLLPGLRLLGPQGVNDRVGVFSVTVDGLAPSDLARELERRFGVLTRPGIHCAPHVHRTFGTDPDAAAARGEQAGATRFSLGPFLSLQDVKAATDALAVITEEHARAGAPAS